MNKYIKAFIVVMLIFLLCGNLSVAPSSAQNPPQALVGSTERVSVSSEGMQGNEGSTNPSISADGRYVVFESYASNLVIGDTYLCVYFNCADIFLHDRQTGETTRVSVASDGTQGDGESYNATISDDGRYVAFTSGASNLVVGDTNDISDVFVRDLETSVTTRVSVASDGTQGDGYSFGGSFSADVRYLTFSSSSSNLVVGDTNGFWDVFVHDRETSVTTRISVNSDGTQGDRDSSDSTISADGRYSTFSSSSSNLVVGDTNGFWDVFVHDRVTGETSRVSVSSEGNQANSYSEVNSISANGRFITFKSYASNLVDGDTAMCYFRPSYYNCSDIFVHDRETGETTRVSVASDGTQADRDSSGATISADGRYVVFSSAASNLVVGDTNGDGDVYLHDRVTGETTRVSLANDGTQGNYGSEGGSISADGRYVMFVSSSTNLVVGDTNNTYDVFVRDREGLVVGYSVSGHVTDTDGNPLPGVNISAGYGYSAITDSQGDYTIPGLLSGTYWITPSLAGYYFSPIYRETSVPPQRVGVNFTEGFPAFLPMINR
jgi:hypothetical protein